MPAALATTMAFRGGNRPPLSRHASASRKGSAIAMRQKAEAVGPVSARRTSSAPIDSAILPASSARNAQRPTRRHRAVFLVEAFDLGCHLDFLLILTIVQAPRRP